MLWRVVQWYGCNYARESITGGTGMDGGGARSNARDGRRSARRYNEGTASCRGRVEARGRVGEGKRTSNVGICGRLIEGKSCACSENTLCQSCPKGN